MNRMMQRVFGWFVSLREFKSQNAYSQHDVRRTDSPTETK